MCIITITTWSRANDYMFAYNEKSAWEYCNPIVILEAVFAFNLFLNLNIGVNKIINVLSKSVFSCFLLHSVFIKYIGINKAVNMNPLVMLLHIAVSAVLIYLACFIVYCIYEKTITSIFRVISKKIRLPIIDLSN